jgi:hypothetical protein
MLLGVVTVVTSYRVAAQFSPLGKQPIFTSVQPSDEEITAGKKVCPAMYDDYLAGGRNYSPPEGFKQAATEFGPETALKDDQRSLLWLHLDLTKGMSYAQVKWQMYKGQLTGWRFATPKEIQQLFLDFAGPQSGPLTSDAMAKRFQHELGGPVDFTASAQNGFCRNSSVALVDESFALGHALYGYIANDNFFGPSIKWELQGSSEDDSGARFAASYLVREEPRNRMWRAFRWFLRRF